MQSNCSLIGFLTAISYSTMYIIHETTVTGKDCLSSSKNYVIYMNNTHFVRHWIVWCISRPIISPHTTACFISGMDTIVRCIAMIAITSWRSAERSTTRWVWSLFVGPVYHVFCVISYVIYNGRPWVKSTSKSNNFYWDSIVERIHEMKCPPK